VKYLTDPILLSCGQVKFVFENDAAGTSETISGDLFLDVGEIDASVEDSGAGGVMLIDDLNIELYDRGGIFHDIVFGTAGVTKCSVKVYLGADMSVGLFNGFVYLPSIEYYTIYGTETTCRFTAHSILKELESHAAGQIMPTLNGAAESFKWQTYTGYTFVKVETVFNAIQDLLPTSNSAITPVEYVHDFEWFNTLEGDHSYLPLLYFMFYDFSTSAATPYWTITWTTLTGTITAELLTSNITGSGTQFTKELKVGDAIRENSTNGVRTVVKITDDTHLIVDSGWIFAAASAFSVASPAGIYTGKPNALELLKQLAGDFLFVPILVWDAVNDVVHLKMIQRHAAASNSTDMGDVLESTQSNFQGYDAIRVNHLTPGVAGVFYNAYPAWISDADYNLLSLKFDYAYSFLMNTNGAGGSDPYKRLLIYGYVDPATGLYEIKGVKSTALGTFSPDLWVNFLLNGFMKYWRYSVLLERKYAGISASTVNLLDKITVDGNDYSIIEIKRNLLENTKTIKMIGI
jgi:hypothetical protein